MKHLLSILSLVLFLNTNAQQWEKAKVFHNIINDYTYRHFSDNQGNIYIVGGFSEDPLILDSTILLSNGNLDIFIVKLDSNFMVIWAKSLGSKNDDYVTGIYCNSKSEIILSGSFNDSMIIGGKKLLSRGLSDFFITKIDTEGNWIWAKSAGSQYEESHNGIGGGIFEDSSGNIYVAGTFGYEYNSEKPNHFVAYFDSLSVKSFGNQDAFVAKYTQDGNIIWVKNFGSFGGDDGGELYLKDNYIYICGGSQGNFYYDSSILKNPYGVTDFGFIVKMDFHGKIIWVKGPYLKEFGNMNSRSITSDSNGNLYVTGMYYPISFKNRLVFGSFELEEISGIDIFLTKLDRNGNVKWLKRAGGGGNDGPTKIVMKNNNHFLVTGVLTGGGIYENKTITSMSGSNTFVLEIDSNGKPILFEQYGKTGKNNGWDISITDNSKLILSGENWSGTLTFDSITCQTTDKPASFYIARRNFIAKPVGIEKEIKSNPFKIYPNPSSGNFTIELENANKNGFISIYNPMGMLIKTINLHSPNKIYIFDIDVSPGIYFVNLKIGENNFSQTISIVN